MSIMTAGRALDELVAEKVMGYRWWRRQLPITGTKWLAISPAAPNSLSGACVPCGPDDNNLIAEQPTCPLFSTDIRSAWLVVERLRDRWTAATELSNGVNDDFVHPFDDRVFFEHLRRHADRRWPWCMLYLTAEAICVAALKAVGVEHQQLPQEAPRPFDLLGCPRQAFLEKIESLERQRGAAVQPLNPAVEELDNLAKWVRLGHYDRDDARDEIARAIENRARQLRGPRA